MTRPDPHGPSRLRDDAERSLVLVIVAFIVTVVETRGFLQATGYPQVGGGELHIAHMLWGGLLLVAAALLGLVVTAPWVTPVVAIATGAGTGLFIDEIGKFITATNDYFYPLAAPLIYGVLLALALVLLLVRRAPGGAQDADGRPGAVPALLSRTAFRRLLVAALVFLAVGWLASLAVYLALDDAQIRVLIERFAQVPGDRIERPTEVLFYFLEVAVLGASGALLLLAAIVLATGRDRIGTAAALAGLTISLTAGALLSLYVEQIAAMTGAIGQALVLLGVLRYRRRFLGSGAGDPA